MEKILKIVMIVKFNAYQVIFVMASVIERGLNAIIQAVLSRRMLMVEKISEHKLTLETKVVALFQFRGYSFYDS